MTLYKDTNNNLWDYLEYDDESQMHLVTVVDEDDGHYTNTGITWGFTDEELANCTKIEVEVENNA
jgi:hypothetical protein